MAGVVPGGADGARYRATFIDNLRCTADRFAAHDKRILIEALRPGVKRLPLFSQYQALGIAKEVDHAEMYSSARHFPRQKVDGNLSHLIRGTRAAMPMYQIASLPDRHMNRMANQLPWLFRLFDDVRLSRLDELRIPTPRNTTPGRAWLVLACWRNPELPYHNNKEDIGCRLSLPAGRLLGQKLAKRLIKLIAGVLA